jgi:hypothetical protein
LHHCDVAEQAAADDRELRAVADVRFRTLVAAHMWHDALPLCDLVEPLYRAAEDQASLGLIAAVRIENWLSGRASVGVADWRELATSLVSTNNGLPSVRVLMTVLAAAHQQGNRSVILKLLPLIDEMAASTSGERERVELFALSTRMNCAHGDESTAARSSLASTALATRAADPLSTVVALGAQGITELTFGSVECAVERYRAAWDLANRHGLHGFAERFVGDFGWALAEAG